MLRVLAALTCVLAVSSSDVASLVQSRLTSHNESVVEGPPPPKSYRVVYGKTWGSYHACLTEMAFLDSLRQPLQARLEDSTSCYGCPVSCYDCDSEWGDASKLFDMVALSNEANAWSCTNIGSFIGGVGISKPTVSFTLPRRPAKAIFKSGETGDWTPRDWVLQEYQPVTGRWETIATVVDNDVGSNFRYDRYHQAEQSFFIQVTGTAENPAKWTVDYADCNGAFIGEATLPVVPSVDPPAMSATFTEAEGLNLASSGDFSFDWGHGISIDGDFGTITIGTIVYETRQLNFNFPSKHVSPDGNQAEGEMTIVVQKVGSLGIFDLAVIDILLQLKEEGAPDDATRDFFLKLGLENLPRQGEPHPINGSISLSPFLPHLEAGLVMMPNCSKYTPWYVLGKPAYITGSILQAFIDGPPDPTPMPTFFNATLVNMTDEQKAIAMAARGMKPDGSPLITAEERAIIARGPVPIPDVSAGPAMPGAEAEGPTVLMSSRR